MRDAPRLQSEPRGGVPDVTDDIEGYQRACERLASGSGPLAADAERASGFRYGREDQLIQFKREGSGIVLLDPVALDRLHVDWAELMGAVGDVDWIIHDSLQDLPGFADLGLVPVGLFDTEIAARMLGLKRFGLAAVTARFLGITLAKEHSAADWSYRPIPRDWRNYAALDVELLIELDEVMTDGLVRQGKLEWAQEEFRHALRRGTAPRPVDDEPWRHLSGITSLGHDALGLEVARALWLERDRLAREHDIAPSLLLSDRAIVEAARLKPRNGAEFRAIRALNERVRVRTGDDRERMFERYAPIQRQVRPSIWRRVIAGVLEPPAHGEPRLVRTAGEAAGRTAAVAPAPRDVGARSGGHRGGLATAGGDAGSGGVRTAAGGGDEVHAEAPRSMKVWSHHPDRMRRLRTARDAIRVIAEDTRTPADLILRPQALRNLCWTDEPGERDVASFLVAEGARPWQVGLVAESLSRAIM
ncbi:HRDC domain-containing protein [uncultured Bifidobacterium sp.]|uniref:HRDC domain-containing protein n=1 Tax=uncultured Bifidobacterium sp. TaxID=165187 RepID=UPI0028DCA1F5|nr:HRDC domain-containing protein [uncultured Bifidobacterium sp.]